MNFLNRTYLVSVLFLIFPSTASSQFRSFKFDNLTIDDGLSNNSVNCILQTRDGFLWIATKDGLNRYDGQNFKIFKNNPAIKKSLPENYVMSLLESSEGTFWVGTWGGGLCKFDPLHETFIRYDLPSKDDDYIQAIHEDQYGNIWYGTTNNGLNKLIPRTKKIINYGLKNSGSRFFPDDNITCIEEDKKNNLWIGTLTAGLIKFNQFTESFIQFKHIPGDINTVSSNFVWNIYNDSYKKFLLSTENGIDIFNLETEKFARNLDTPEYPSIGQVKTYRQVIKDHEGNIWAGTFNYFGLFLFPNSDDHNNHLHFRKQDDDINSLVSDRIRWLYEDKSFNIWIGTEGGISKLSSSKPFIQYKYLLTKKQTLGGKVVSSIIADKDSTLWIGYGGSGFDKMDLKTNKIIHFNHQPNNYNSLSVDDVVAMFLDSKGILWIGTSYGGLNKFDPETEKFISYKHIPGDPGSIKSDWVQQILETSHGLFLVGTNDGLQVFDRKTEKFNEFIPNTCNKLTTLPKVFSVNSLFEDKDGNIWIGTWLDGLYWYEIDKKKLYHFYPITGDINSLSASKVTTMCEDSKGYIWIGTHSGGIDKFDKSNKKFSRYTTIDGLPNDVVFGIQEDKNGNIWISTMKGLAKFNPVNETFRTYDQSDGIIHNQFNWHASYKDKKGIMYFGGQNGFIVFNPAEILIDSTKSPIAFTSFKVFNKEAALPQSLPATKEILLNYNQNFFSIEFAALDMATPNKHKYLYRLEGIDQDWINAELRTTAYYTDIDPGEYKFLVKASNADNIWSQPISLSIIINPAWWMTWWFKVLVGLTVIFIGFLFYRFRLSQLLKIERIRYDIASDLHDEIGSNLSSISVDGQLLQKSKSLTEKEHELSTDISKTASQTLEAMRDIIWFINPKNDEGEDIIYKMKETASRLLAGISWTFNASNGIKFDNYSLEKRRNIFLIYKEALTNVIRHSNARECNINVEELSGNILIIVKDNGIGFEINKVKKNTGILSMMKRTEKINGKLDFISEQEAGTTVSLMVNTKKGFKQ